MKEALERDSAEQAASINDVAVKILADHYSIRFQGTGRRSPGSRGSTTIMLRLPPRLYQRIHRDALPPKTKSEVVERIFCDHYELAYPASNGRRAAAAS